MISRRHALAGLLGPSLLRPAHADVPVLQVVIDLRSEIAAGRFDPQRDRIGIRGAHPPLSWSRTWPADETGQAGLYRTRIAFERPPFGDQPVAYKFKIERPGAPGGEGWEPGPNHRVRLAPGARVERAWAAVPEPLPARRTGRFDRFAMADGTTTPPRGIQVWLPPAYGEEPSRRHPLLVMHDGQNLFDDTAAGSEWQLDETAERLVRAGQIAPPLIVGIESKAQRIHDYTPWPGRLRSDGPAAAVGGGGPAYADWIARVLLPELERRYPVEPGPQRRFVGGSSLGGLLSMWMLLHQPGQWGGALVVSPSVWWADEALLGDIGSRPAGPPPRLWLDIGLQEGESAVAGARRLHRRLLVQGWPHRHTEAPDGGHDEVSWAARGEAMLRFLFEGN
jgi:predicted alpha/beta superfamily hydrolase